VELNSVVLARLQRKQKWGRFGLVWFGLLRLRLDWIELNWEEEECRRRRREGRNGEWM